MKPSKLKFDLADGMVSTKLIELGGFWIALQRFGVWENGVRYIGCLNIPIREALENEVMIYFESEDVVWVMEYLVRFFPDPNF